MNAEGWESVGALLTSEQPFIWSVSRMRVSLCELWVINPFCLHSSVVWRIDWSVLLFYLLAEANRNRALSLLRCTHTPKCHKTTFKIKPSYFLGTGRARNWGWGCSWQWGQGAGLGVLAKGNCAHLVVFKCRPQWNEVLASQDARHCGCFSITASSVQPLSLRGFTIVFFSESEPFVCHSKENRFMYCASSIARKVTY